MFTVLVSRWRNQYEKPGSDHMELLWIVLSLLALDLAALLFAADTRPGFRPTAVRGRR
jgi:hypothetical protein